MSSPRGSTSSSVRLDPFHKGHYLVGGRARPELFRPGAGVPSRCRAGRASRDDDRDDVLVGKNVVPAHGLAGEARALAPHLGRLERPVELCWQAREQRLDRVPFAQDDRFVLVRRAAGGFDVRPNEAERVADPVDSASSPSRSRAETKIGSYGRCSSTNFARSAAVSCSLLLTQSSAGT